jgi:23S rRNA (pseudouridine1915-N3)-methyltransferase
MKITVLQVGKTKDKAFLDIEDEFLKRLRPFADIDIITIKTSDQKTENQQLQAKIPDGYTVVALDLTGKQMASEDFAKFIEKQRDHEGGKVVFMIGGPHGFTPETLSRAHHKLSLSKMTFTHQMVRLFLLEQIYRGFTILAGKTYHY